MTKSFARQTFLGLTYDLASLDQTLDWVAEAARRESFVYIVTPNVDHVVRLQDRPVTEAIALAYGEASLTLCDSRILGALAKLSGIDLTIVPGSDLTAALLGSSRFDGLHVLVVGGTIATLDMLARRFDRVRWTQFIPGPRVLSSAEDQRTIMEAVTSARADLVFMAFGAPQSELVCWQIQRSGTARGVALCVGASLEFLTGEKRRAPRIFQRLYLEWLFRLLSEPRRLWRRYLVVGPRVFHIWWNSRRS